MINFWELFGNLLIFGAAVGATAAVIVGIPALIYYAANSDWMGDLLDKWRRS